MCLILVKSQIRPFQIPAPPCRPLPATPKYVRGGRRRSDLKAGESVDRSGFLDGSSDTDIPDGTNSDNDVLDGKLIPMGSLGVIV